jgi:CheY-like chemotaxis protein
MKGLIVDDDEDVIYAEKAILEKAGYEVITAQSGKECIEMLKTQRVDFILMDVMMPEMNGWEVTKIIKEDEKTKDIPVIFVTVKGTDDDQTRSFIYSHGNGHIVKPINQQQLLETIKWVLDKGGIK